MPCGAPAAVTALGSTVTAVALGSWHACAVKDDHSLYCWGLAEDGQLGTGSTKGAQTCGLSSACEPSPVQVTSIPSTVIDVEAAGSHTCARTMDGVYCWGDNKSGQVGNGSMATPIATPALVNGLCR